MKTSNAILGISIVLFTFIVGFFFYKHNFIDVKQESYSTHKYTIKNTHVLPDILNEVSGIAWINENTFACIQDEDGYIFIYDIKINSILKTIKFAGHGDYEAIAIHNNDAYVLRSDGLIYALSNYNTKAIKTSKIKTVFDADNNMESLTFDTQNNQLLISPKDKDLGPKHLRSVYKIPLDTKTVDTIPVFSVNLKSEILKDFKHKHIRNTLCPSEIAVHPMTQDIYVLEGKNPKLIILNNEGIIKNAIKLNKKQFAQPEGLTFSDDGRLFISNEADNGNANILEVVLE
ncbi:SdiA-regulated domain-containing protein [Winogradskyella eckloniae]|uniref:SdiA-regulated domain-containing protein n=1 Tax=Winogradskyella eckloniae TaxID=1089306 RepID=UPI0015679D39|nr:SdiA-regulated domain-containing protein [Winogradskyella eckloniae]NRD19384.1 SdiA-regulated domain-containing protein [Winogradskyella eckloniae]